MSQPPLSKDLTSLLTYQSGIIVIIGLATESFALGLTKFLWVPLLFLRFLPSKVWDSGERRVLAKKTLLKKPAFKISSCPCRSPLLPITLLNLCLSEPEEFPSAPCSLPYSVIYSLNGRLLFPQTLSSLSLKRFQRLFSLTLSSWAFNDLFWNIKKRLHFFFPYVHIPPEDIITEISLMTIRDMEKGPGSGN